MLCAVIIARAQGLMGLNTLTAAAVAPWQWRRHLRVKLLAQGSSEAGGWVRDSRATVGDTIEWQSGFTRARFLIPSSSSKMFKTIC